MGTKEIIPSEIHEIPSIIRDTVNLFRNKAEDVGKKIINQNAKRIIIIGNGTSYFTSLASTYAARELADVGKPFYLAMPAGDFRHFPPLITNEDVIIGISASGEFKDVLSVLETYSSTCYCVGITQVPNSSITKLTNNILIPEGGKSHAAVMTKTFASTLVAEYLLVLSIFSAAEEYYLDLLNCADRVEEALESAESLIPKIISEISSLDHVFCFGAGSGAAAAMEGALKIKEMALVHAEGNEVWEFASGSATIINQQSLCVPFYTGHKKDNDVQLSATQSKSWGARLLEVGSSNTNDDLYLPVNPGNFDCFSPLSLVPPIALLGYHLARFKKIDPNKPQWLDRYHAQGLNHVIEG